MTPTYYVAAYAKDWCGNWFEVHTVSPTGLWSAE